MSGASDIQVVVFGLGDEEFALPVTTVREILDHRNAYRVPHAPDWFLGLTDVRGDSVPMVDLRVRLGMPPVEPTLTTRVLVVDVAGGEGKPLALGMVVDRVLDVATFPAESVEGAPDLGGRWRSEQIEAILRRGAGFVALLDPARLFGAEVPRPPWPISAWRRDPSSFRPPGVAADPFLSLPTGAVPLSSLARAASASPDALQRRDFDRISAYVYKECGIRLPPAKMTMIEGRLRRRVRATGLSSLGDYCAWVFQADHLAGEREHLLNAVTTNKTDFFREPKHFDYLMGTVMPQLRDQGQRRIRVWSSACSTGAEPYTLAMLLDAFAADKGGPDFGILATDLDSEVLRTARRGIYPAAMLDPVPTTLRKRYVMSASDPRRDEMRIVPALRSAIGFAQMNLMDERYPVGDPMDIIFCRNVLIYFDKPTQEKVVRRLAECLRPGGWMFLGHSESITGFDLPLKTVSNTVFQRI